MKNISGGVITESEFHTKFGLLLLLQWFSKQKAIKFSETNTISHLLEDDSCGCLGAKVAQQKGNR